ncbi:MAG TPA: ABC transporter permease [Mycobacteriales bacterium]|nr:ABC transporter permease [Mycobacteriales bacterium]
MSTLDSGIAAPPPAVGQLAPPPLPTAPSSSTSDSPPAAPRARGGRLPRGLARSVSPVAAVLLWQLASSTGVLPARLLAAPSTVLRSGWELIRSGQLGEALLVSLQRVVVGLVLGLAIGLTLGLLTGLSRWGELLLDPIVQALRTLPFLGLIPLFILWFGIGETPKIALVALGVTFPIYLNTFAGIRGVDARLIEAAATLGLGRSQRWVHVVLPAALPSILVGLRYALGIAWLSLIVGEQVNATAGLGYLINDAREFLRTDVVVVGLLVYAALGLATDAAVRLLERRALAWRQSFVPS